MKVPGRIEPRKIATIKHKFCHSIRFSTKFQRVGVGVLRQLQMAELGAMLPLPYIVIKLHIPEHLRRSPDCAAPISRDGKQPRPLDAHADHLFPPPQAMALATLKQRVRRGGNAI